jgi:hypothetical protein
VSARLVSDESIASPALKPASALATGDRPTPSSAWPEDPVMPCSMRSVRSMAAWE